MACSEWRARIAAYKANPGHQYRNDNISHTLPWNNNITHFLPNGTLYGNMTDGHNISPDIEHAEWMFKTIQYSLYHVGLPIVCSFGIIGNILNLLILTRKQLKRTMDHMEKSVHLGKKDCKCKLFSCPVR